MSQIKIHPEMDLPKVKDGMRSSSRTVFLPYMTQRPASVWKIILGGTKLWVGIRWF